MLRKIYYFGCFTDNFSIYMYQKTRRTVSPRNRFAKYRCTELRNKGPCNYGNCANLALVRQKFALSQAAVPYHKSSELQRPGRKTVNMHSPPKTLGFLPLILCNFSKFFYCKFCKCMLKWIHQSTHLSGSFVLPFLPAYE